MEVQQRSSKALVMASTSSSGRVMCGGTTKKQIKHLYSGVNGEEVKECGKEFKGAFTTNLKKHIKSCHKKK